MRTSIVFLQCCDAAEIALRVGVGAKSAAGESTMESRLNGNRAMADRTRHSIRRVREKLGMTQEQFAHTIAVTVSTVSRWETGHAVPSNLAWRAIRELASVHGCMEYLLES
jgi:DNA-binding transcriptional regulator YiaG